MVQVRTWKLSTNSAILPYKLSVKALESPYKQEDEPDKPGQQHTNKNWGVFQA